jgi:hypothetical protein
MGMLTSLEKYINAIRMNIVDIEMMVVRREIIETLM